MLTVARTILDQCLQDMTKTYNKAIKDLAEKINQNNNSNANSTSSNNNNKTSLPEKFSKSSKKVNKNNKTKTEEQLEISAGFPQFKKHNYSCSVRFQITSSEIKNILLLGQKT